MTRDELAALRLRLRDAYAFELVARDDQRLLFLRSPRAEPDPVSDLEDCLERVPDWALADVTDVFLLGGTGSFHVGAKTLQPVLDRRRRIDDALLQHWRNELDTNYGLGLHRVTGDPQNLVRLGVRLPRPKVSDLTESDLVRIARAAGPLLESGEAATVRLAYLLAEEDHVRLLGDDFFNDAQPRWTELQNPPTPMVPALPAETTTPPPARVPRRRPTRVLNVRPAVELETQADASTDPDRDLEQLAQAEKALEHLLNERNFDVRLRVEHDETLYAFAAERAAGYPRRVLVKTFPRFGRDEDETMLREVRSLDADLLIVLAPDADVEAKRRTLATKVKVIRPDEVAALSL